MIDRALHDKLKRVCDLLWECHEQLVGGGLDDDARIIRASFVAASPVRDRVGYLLDNPPTKKVVKKTILEPTEDNER